MFYKPFLRLIQYSICVKAHIQVTDHEDVWSDNQFILKCKSYFCLTIENNNSVIMLNIRLNVFLSECEKQVALCTAVEN